jgi:DNA-directed RNA polymerase beta subunit
VPFEQSVPVPAPHAGVVDQVLVYKERNGADACKVRVRKTRIPTVGDKFASRSAQKGKLCFTFNFVDKSYTNNFSSLFQVLSA